ncbi:MAG: right-handed parallel beta-helix repeat-containing protein [Lachnospiraceae bacterium]|nr:right-handed parallel beta-helix repeat-containing protein [Lachnospiraceae bacterium]
MKKNFLVILMVAAISSALLAGCGKKSADADTSAKQEQEAQEVEAGKAEGAESKAAEADKAESADKKDADNAADEKGSKDDTDKAESKNSDPDNDDMSGNMDGLVDNWVFICSNYMAEYADGTIINSSIMCNDEYAPESKIRVTEEDGTYKVDYRFTGSESERMIYGCKLDYKEEAAFSDSPNTEWCAEFEDPFNDEASVIRRISLSEDDMLIESEEYSTEGDDYSERMRSVTVNYYLREDSPRLEDPEELRYFDTVTVSDAAELLNSVRNNRRIILEEGEYNFSDILPSEIKNTYVSRGFSTYAISNIYNLSIEAKEGADVLICIEDPYEPVLDLENCGNITLKGITAGHAIEPGYCSGSVVYLSGISGIEIDSCKLYGCGTYGIEAFNVYDMNVDKTDIYECTYGLVYLSEVGTVRFKDCTMRDSSDMSMITLRSGYDVTFTDCTIKNNRVEWDNEPFVDLDEYSHVTFKNCTITGNSYDEFSNMEVNLDGCKIDEAVKKDREKEDF